MGLGATASVSGLAASIGAAVYNVAVQTSELSGKAAESCERLAKLIPGGPDKTVCLPTYSLLELVLLGCAVFLTGLAFGAASHRCFCRPVPDVHPHKACEVCLARARRPADRPAESHTPDSTCASRRRKNTLRSVTASDLEEGVWQSW